MPKTVAFATLGCKVNHYETDALTEQFERRGYQVVPFDSQADVYVINTCTVTHIGDRKSRQLIRRARRANDQGFIVATGCYAQIAPQELEAIGGINLLIGTRGREHLAEMVDEQLEKGSGPRRAVVEFEDPCPFEELPITRTVSRARAYIKVQEGCRAFCTYCIVPYTRGPCRSRTVELVREEAIRLVANGYIELVLTGTHLGSWGRDLPGRPPLAELLSRLVDIPGLLRLRLSSIEPLAITPAIIDLMENPILCPHLHISLQSGDDTILRRMGRRYTTREYALLVGHARTRIRDLAVTTDVIVGFPGETEEQFANTRDFLQRTAFAGLHVFRFSPRRGTPAARYKDQVSPAVKKRRSTELLAVDAQLRQEFAVRYVGQTVEVLVEKVENGRAEGFTGNYLRVSFPGEERMVGSLQRVQAVHAAKGNLSGIIYNGEGFGPQDV